MQKVSVVSGIKGQDGSILLEKLLNKGHKVYGLIRRSSQGLDLGNSKHLENNPNLVVVEGDITDPVSMNNLFKTAKANFCYHAASQSHVHSSFDQPIYTAQATGLATLYILEAIRNSGIHTRFLNMASSEMMGGLTDEPGTELTPFHPRSPYGVAKVYGFFITQNFRESYKMFACSSINYNHEEPGKRGPNFVTRKITLGIRDIKSGKKNKLYLGNLDARRDWSLASDVCDGMILMLESSEPKDYVMASGETHSVREFCKIAFEHAGLGDYQKYVEIDPQFFRPAEVHVLLGDSSKIRRELGWSPKCSFEELVKRMVDFDLKDLPKNHLDGLENLSLEEQANELGKFSI